MIVTDKKINFNDLEKKIHETCCKMGCELIKTKLEEWDKELSESRDKSMYRHKGKRKTVIKTLMGEVEYERVMYEVTEEDGTKSYVYLLDEAMGIEGSGFMSGLLSSFIVKAACEGPYRSVAESVSQLTGQAISHTAAWNTVQDIGSRIDKKEKAEAEAVSQGDIKGTLESAVLFEEQDGIWLKLQKGSRKEYGSSREMKVAIAYDGAQQTEKERYRLTNKVACANFEETKKFVKRKEGVIAQTYNTDEIKERFLNGDGAAWIKQSITDDTVHFQLDPFHRNKAIRTYVKDADMRKQITKLLYDQEIDNLLNYIEACSNSVEEEKEQKNLLELHTYFKNNRDGLVPYNQRGIEIPAPPAGKEYRHMGAMESNIFTLIGNRMKGRRACWSIEGGNNLARLLCQKITGRLSDTLKKLTHIVVPEKYAQEITTNLSASKVAKCVGKGYDGYPKASASPSTPDYKWLRDLGGRHSFA